MSMMLIRLMMKMRENILIEYFMNLKMGLVKLLILKHLKLVVILMKKLIRHLHKPVLDIHLEILLYAILKFNPAA